AAPAASSMSRTTDVRRSTTQERERQRWKRWGISARAEERSLAGFGSAVGDRLGPPWRTATTLGIGSDLHHHLAETGAPISRQRTAGITLAPRGTRRGGWTSRRAET